MRKKVSVDPREDEIAPVKFKPIFGIRPAAYIGVFYLAALFLVLFFLLLFPGLRNSGSAVTFLTIPEGASVRVDGVRVGFTPLTAFVARGRRTITILKPGLATLSVQENIPGRLFGSLFAKRKHLVSYRLSSERPEGLLASAHADFATWTLNGEPTANHRFPLFLSEGVSDFSLIENAKEQDKAWKMLASAAAQVNSEGSMKDFVRASLLAGSRGRALTPLGLAETAAFFSRLYASHELLPFWLAATLPEKAATGMTSSPGISKTFDALSVRMKAGLSRPKLRGTVSRPVRIGPWDFAVVPGGEYYIGWSGVSDSSGPRDSLSPPHLEKVLPFMLSATEVTEEDFSQFLLAEKDWAPANREALIADGRADKGYLQSWKDGREPPRPSYPVREVSYFAAKAYCEYLGRLFPAYVFSLPTETQWEWAASLDSSADKSAAPYSRELKPARFGTSGLLGLKFMAGNVWEWCRDWYAPAAYIFGSPTDFSGAEKVVRGGAFINPEDSVSLSTRGSQPPSWCTPYLGFRVAAQKRE